MTITPIQRCGCGGIPVAYKPATSPIDGYEVECPSCNLHTIVYVEETKAIITWNRALRGRDLERGTKVKIQKGIPMPAPHAGVDFYPWQQMEIGDSFYVPGKTPAAVSSIAFKASKSNAPRVFKSRAWAKGGRIWRIK